MTEFDTAEKILFEHLAVQPDEVVGIVIDHQSIIVDSLISACKGSEVSYDIIEIPEDRANSSPIPEVYSEMEECDAIVAPTRNSISHSPETTKLRGKGKRFITLPGITKDLYRKILEADLEDIISIETKVHEQVKDAKEIRVKTPAGTDITMEIGRKWKLSKMVLEPSDLTNLPTGELFTAPMEASAKGVIAIDHWKSIITPGDRAKVIVKDGKITDWNEAALPYVETLKKGGNNGLVIAEFGIGSNKAHKEPIGNILHDEKIYGTCHIAFGQNTSFSGSNEASVHEDVILLEPEIFADGEKLEQAEA